jgi:hypothetical protein
MRRLAMISIKKYGYMLFFVLLAALILPVSVDAEEIIAYIGDLGGKVTVTKPAAGDDSGKEIAAKSGMLLAAGDVLRTGEESFASVIFQDDGSRVKLGPVATVTLNATRKQKQLDKSLVLDTGKLWAKVTKKRGAEFQVKTPTSVASVKGTRFIIEETEEGETWLWVLEDAVSFSNGTDEVTVNEGEVGRATSDTIDIQPIDKDQLPVEPGTHEMIFFFKGKDDSSLQRELHIEFEVK